MRRALRILDRRTYSELRRRILRGALRPLLRARPGKLWQNLLPADVRRILICRPNHRLGNLLLLTPLLQEIEARVPDARVDIVAAGGDAGTLFAGFDRVRRVYCLSRRIVRHLPATARIVAQIRGGSYDVAIDPCLTSQSGRLLATVAGADSLLGFPRGRDTAAWAELDPWHCVPRHVGRLPVFLLRRALGCDYGQLRAAYPPLDIRLSASERAGARAALVDLLSRECRPSTLPLIGVFGEATGAKRYAREWWRHFIAVIQMRYPASALVEILPPDGRPRLALDLPTFCSPDPRKVAAMISAMTCFVSADCGVMHLASASGTPTIGLFSASDVAKYQPYGRGSGALVTTGKSPEEVAQLACVHIDGLVAAIFNGAAVPDP